MSERVADLTAADFEELYAQYATDVLRVCYYYLGDRHKAEDVTQDVFVKLLTTKPNLQAGSEKSWLLKVALNRCRDLWRSSWLKRVTLGSPVFELIPSPDEFRKLEDEQALLEAINKLPPDFKEAVLLFYYQNCSIPEIAAITGEAEGTISSRLSRGRKKLYDLLGKDFAGMADT